jgi:biopolymer transport protein ExbD
MSMSVPGSDSEESVMSEINTTPLVDVMLVMLIIFLITIPVITKTVPVELPKAANIPTQTKPENITVAVNTAGDIFWNGASVADSTQMLNLVVAAARQVPQPEVHIRADLNTRYEAIGRVIFMIQRGGISKVGFLTEPDHGTRVVR